MITKIISPQSSFKRNTISFCANNKSNRNENKKSSRPKTAYFDNKDLSGLGALQAGFRDMWLMGQVGKDTQNARLHTQTNNTIEHWQKMEDFFRPELENKNNEGSSMPEDFYKESTWFHYIKQFVESVNPYLFSDSTPQYMDIYDRDMPLRVFYGISDIDNPYTNSTKEGNLPIGVLVKFPQSGDEIVCDFKNKIFMREGENTNKISVIDAYFDYSNSDDLETLMTPPTSLMGDFKLDNFYALDTKECKYRKLGFLKALGKSVSASGLKISADGTISADKLAILTSDEDNNLISTRIYAKPVMRVIKNNKKQKYLVLNAPASLIIDHYYTGVEKKTFYSYPRERYAIKSGAFKRDAEGAIEFLKGNIGKCSVECEDGTFRKFNCRHSECRHLK